MLLVRRSQTRKTVMETTKTGVLQNIALPTDLMDVLRWHVERLDSGPELLRNSELLFPSEVGAFRSASCLDRPFREIAEAAGIKKHLTPRSMRRTFNDLCRRAEVRDVVTRSISGHLTEGMQRHYSTVAADEQRASLAKVVCLAGFRAALLTDRGTHPDAAQDTPNEYPGSASPTGKMEEEAGVLIGVLIAVWEDQSRLSLVGRTGFGNVFQLSAHVRPHAAEKGTPTLTGQHPHTPIRSGLLKFGRRVPPRAHAPARQRLPPCLSVRG
jgi:hypothetical protein